MELTITKISLGFFTVKWILRIERNLPKEKQRPTTIAKILSEIPDIEKKKTETKMRISAIIDDELKAQGISHSRFTKLMNRNAITTVKRWLSGTNNFTIETLVEIGQVLGIDFIIKRRDTNEGNRCTQVPKKDK